ncbi:MAG: 4Fe-4S binding protein [Oscillibacter sp.]|nr:4Fe-4S binding protein [Oscillibacter sp.]
MAVSIILEKCISCGACEVLCPQKAITLYWGGAQVNPNLCTACGLCICKCYTRAIRTV